ncbi:MAG TPA: hypothetical protein VJ836_05795 [Candidatus Saccharimonadales bacterium]|nr:hypothetical protein [Candidatus Saccharimonadales bacterium]
MTDTIGGLTLGRVLEALPNSPVAKGAWAESADPAEAVRILQPIPFLQVMGDTLISEAIGNAYS